MTKETVQVKHEINNLDLRECYDLTKLAIHKVSNSVNYRDSTEEDLKLSMAVGYLTGILSIIRILDRKRGNNQ